LFNASKAGIDRLVPGRHHRFRHLNCHYSLDVCFIKATHRARTAGAFDIRATHGSNSLGHDVCLSAHSAATPAPGSADSYSRIVTDIGRLYIRRIAHFPFRAGSPSINASAAAKDRPVSLINFI